MGKIICLLFLSIAVAVFKPAKGDIKTELLEMHEECARTSGVDEKEILDKVLEGNFEDEEQVKTHVLCVGKKLKVIDDDNKIAREVLKAQLREIITEDRQVDEIVTKCAVEKDDVKDTVFTMMKCIHDIIKED